MSGLAVRIAISVSRFARFSIRVDASICHTTSGYFTCSASSAGIRKSIASESVVVILTSPASRSSSPCVNRWKSLADCSMRSAASSTLSPAMVST
ncbi:hypothetical protein D9M69_694840 [compost metagenome]